MLLFFLYSLAGIVFPRASDSYGTSFLMSFLLCGTVEYLTSYLIEKRFHARWWDYSQKPMNLHGRVWIGNLILFGMGGIAILHLLNPVIERLAAVKAVEVQYVNQTFEGDRLPIYACGENRYSIRKDGQLAVNCSFCLAAETETTE